MQSIWSMETKLPNPRPKPVPLKAQAVVIGAGLAGLLTAYTLQNQGIQVIVLEKDRIGSGQTKNTTAKVTAQHGDLYHRLLAQHGEEKTAQYAQANRQALEDYRRIITENKINCSWQEAPAAIYSETNKAAMEKEYLAQKKVGLPVCFGEESQLPFPVAGLVTMEGQAHFQPLEFLRFLGQNLTVYENTQVWGAQGKMLETSQGDLQAEYLIFASHFPCLRLPGAYFARLHQERSYVLALANAPCFSKMYLGCGGNGWSFRQAGEYLLFGGEGHRTGENSTGGQYKKLAGQAAAWWPHCREAARWSAQDCITLDGIPYIGQFSRYRPNWYVATGFGKWGMTTSMVAARIIADSILGRKNETALVFSPQRFSKTAAKSMLVQGGKAAKSIARQLFVPPKGAVEELPLGSGGIVQWQGKKAGVYKDMAGQVFVVEAKCPHMGCQLEWNPEEKTWDCPCHGSRFDQYGALLEGPAARGCSNE